MQPDRASGDQCCGGSARRTSTQYRLWRQSAGKRVLLVLGRTHRGRQQSACRRACLVSAAVTERSSYPQHHAEVFPLRHRDGSGGTGSIPPAVATFEPARASDSIPAAWLLAYAVQMPTREAHFRNETTTGAHSSLGSGPHICLSKPPSSIQSQFCCFIEVMQLAVGVITPNPLQVEENRARRNMTALP
jgi:hypothetical protein